MHPDSENLQLTDFVPERSGSSRGVVVAVWMWAVAVLIGAATLLQYSLFEGARADVPLRQPEKQSVTAAEKSKADVFVFVHPHCPCSRATVTQLNRLTERSDSEAIIHVLFFCPDSQPDAWTRTTLWAEAAKNDELVCSIDRGGRRAAEFGVRTSGHVVAFDPTGQRTFSGGITGSRGHAGACRGSDVLMNIIQGREVCSTELPVFGCAFVGADSGEAN